MDLLPGDLCVCSKEKQMGYNIHGVSYYCSFSRLTSYPYTRIVHTQHSIKSNTEGNEGAFGTELCLVVRSILVLGLKQVILAVPLTIPSAVPLHKRFYTLSKCIIAVRRPFLFQPPEYPKPIQSESNPLCASWRLIRRDRQTFLERGAGATSTRTSATNGENGKGLVCDPL